MPIHIDKNQLFHFRKFGFVTLEGLLREEPLQNLSQSMLENLQANNPGAYLPELDSSQAYLSGSNNSLKDPAIQKILMHQRITRCLEQLSSQRKLFLAGDTCIKSSDQKQPEKTAIDTILARPRSLQDINSVKPLIGSLIIPIESQAHIEGDKSMPQEKAVTEDESLTEELSISIRDILPKAGQVTFVRPDASIDFTALFENSNLYYMVVHYASDRAYYQENRLDPTNSFLKSLGYVFGDGLSGANNPFVFLS